MDALSRTHDAPTFDAETAEPVGQMHKDAPLPETQPGTSDSTPSTPLCPLVSNAKALLLIGAISWHHARCGESVHCMPGYLPAVIGTSSGLINTLPKILGSSTLSGLMLLAGSCARPNRPGSWGRIGRTMLPALVTQFVVAPVFDSLVPSTIPTNGHVWFLYSLAFAQLQAELIGRIGGRLALVAVPLLICLCASPVWHEVAALLPALSGAKFDGLTWSSGEWFLPFGVRALTYPFFYAVGVALLPIPVLLDLQTRCAASAFTRRCMWLANGACWIYSCVRLRLGETNLFTSASADVWLSRMPMQLEMLAVSLVSTLALLLLLPNRTVPLLTWAGKHTLVPYLAHPFVLKLLRPLLGLGMQVTGARDAAPGDQGVAVVIETVLVPVLMLGSLAYIALSLKRAQSRVRACLLALVVGLGLFAAAPSRRPPVAASTPSAVAVGVPSPVVSAHTHLAESAMGSFNLTLQNARTRVQSSSQPQDVYLCQLHDAAQMLPQGRPSDWAIQSFTIDDKHVKAAGHVHHVTAFFCEDGADQDEALGRSLSRREPFRCDKVPFMPRCEAMLFTFVTGDSTVRLPQGTALSFKGNLMLLQVHYYLHERGRSHKLREDGHIALDSVPASFELVRVQSPGTSQMELAHFFEVGPRFPTMLNVPPRQERYVVTSACAPACVKAALVRSPSRRFKVYAVRHHMHKLGVSMTTDILHANGSSTRVWTSQDWQPFQALPFHMFDTPIELQTGDAIVARCVYNSMDRSNATYLGSGLLDEMCFSYLLTTHIPDFTNCWHLLADDKVRGGCFGICKGLGQSVSLRSGSPNASTATAQRFVLPEGTGACARGASRSKPAGGAGHSRSASGHSRVHVL